MEYENQTARPVSRPNSFATASLVFGVLALVSVFTMIVIPTIVFGSLSIIFAVLSKGADRKMGNRALGGTIVSASAFVINAAICVISFYVVFSDPQSTKDYLNTMNQIYEEMTGISFDELLESYGIDFDQIQK